MDEMTFDQFLEHIDGDTHALTMDGFDDCVIGAGEIAGQWVVIYDQDKIIDKLSADMSYHEALEYFAFNMTGYIGTGTPVVQSIKIIE
jgi:hypothetical protein